MATYFTQGLQPILDTWCPGKQAQDAEKQAAPYIDPVETFLGEDIQKTTGRIFESYILEARPYRWVRDLLGKQLFPTQKQTLSLLNRVTHYAKAVENQFATISHQKLKDITAAIIAISAVSLYFLPLSPATPFFLAVASLTIIGNHQMLTTVSQSVNDLSTKVHMLFEKTVPLRQTIVESGETYALSIYQKLHPESSPLDGDVVHNGIKDQISNRIHKKVLPFLDTFELNQRSVLYTHLSDALAKNGATLLVTQVAKYLFANAVGVTVAIPLFYIGYASSFFSWSGCSIFSPITYTWNHLTPLHYIWTFSDTCQPYHTILNITAIATWSLFFYSLNKSIHAWGESNTNTFEVAVQKTENKSTSTWGTTKHSLTEQLQTTATEIQSALHESLRVVSAPGVEIPDAQKLFTSHEKED